MSGISGDVRKLVDFQAKIADVADGDFYRQLQKNLAEEARTQVMDEFRQKRDPYGENWKPAYRGGQTLADTGRLRNSFTYEESANGFRIGTNVIYAAPHQYGAVIKAKNAKALCFKLRTGTRVRNAKTGARLKKGVAIHTWITVQSVRIPKRQIIPEGEAGAIWTEALQEAADALMREFVSKD